MRVCLSAYLTLLNLGALRSTTKVELGKAVIGLLDDGPCEGRYNDARVSDLSRGKKNLARIDAARAKDMPGDRAADYFAEKVLPLLDENKLPVLLGSLVKLFELDDSILPFVVVERVTHKDKESLVSATSLNPEEVLAGVFLYLAIAGDNRGTEAFVVEAAHVLERVQSDGSGIAIIRRTKKANAPRALWKKGPNSLAVVEGDLFDYCGNAVANKRVVVIPVDCGFTMELTTSVQLGQTPLISEKSLHGEWLRRGYGGLLSSGCKGIIWRGSEIPDTESDIGAIAVVDEGDCTFFLLASSRLVNGVANSSQREIELALERLLECYDSIGQGYPMYLPLIGTGLSHADMGYEESLAAIVNTVRGAKHGFRGRAVVVIKEEALGEIDFERVNATCGLSN